MHYILAATGLLALVCASPASATDWDSVAGWDVYELGADRCVVGRVFAEPGAATFGVIIALDGEVRVFATRAGWKARTGETIDASVGLDDTVVIAGPQTGIEQQGRNGFVAAAGASFIDRFATARRLTLQMGASGRPDTLQMGGSAAGLAQGRRCLAGLREERSHAGAAMPPVARRNDAARGGVSMASAGRFASSPASVASRSVSGPIPKGSKTSWIAAEDYPDAALRAAEQGAVTVQLAINSSGGVAGCDVVKSSGSAALDGTTCRMIQRRARYKPATDGGGRPVAGVDRHTVRWTLPD